MCHSVFAGALIDASIGRYEATNAMPLPRVALLAALMLLTRIVDPVVEEDGAVRIDHLEVGVNGCSIFLQLPRGERQQSLMQFNLGVGHVLRSGIEHFVQLRAENIDRRISFL